MAERIGDWAHPARRPSRRDDNHDPAVLGGSQCGHRSV
jgi:hypothetical protein